MICSSLVFTIINDIIGNLNILYGLELLILGSGTGTRNLWHSEKTGNMKNSKKFNQLKMCMKYFRRST